MAAFATATDYRNTFSGVGTTGKHTDANIGEVLEQEADEIRSHCKRDFDKLTSADYKFRFGGSPFLIPDFATITVVQVGDTTLDTDKWTALRLPGRPSIFPYNKIEFDSEPALGATITITGERGWDEIPPAIKQLNLQRAAIFLLDGDRSRAQIAIGEEVEAISEESRFAFRRKLRPYIRRSWATAPEL